MIDYATADTFVRVTDPHDAYISSTSHHSFVCVALFVDIYFWDFILTIIDSMEFLPWTFLALTVFRYMNAVLQNRDDYA